VRSGFLGVIALFVLVLSGAAAQVAIDNSFSSQARLVSAVVAGLGAGFGVLVAVIAAEEAAKDVRD